MNKFEKQLEKWNNGVLRGAQARLAKTLGVSTATTAQWATGKRHPSKGYIHKMAELFSIDLFDALKLFDTRTTTYPEPSQRMQMLREKTEEDVYSVCTEEELLSQSNTVRLAFLNSVPDAFPQYDESEVIEWWSVPRRYALGAKYIIRSSDAGFGDAKDADDLCFVQPTDVPSEQHLMLWKTKEGYRCGYGVKEGEHFILQGSNTENSSQPQEQARPLGRIVRRIYGL